MQGFAILNSEAKFRRKNDQHNTDNYDKKPSDPPRRRRRRHRNRTDDDIDE
jgi:hypothetical protein